MNYLVVVSFTAKQCFLVRSVFSHGFSCYLEYFHSFYSTSFFTVWMLIIIIIHFCHIASTIPDQIYRQIFIDAFPMLNHFFNISLVRQLVLTWDPKKEAQAICTELVAQTGDLQKELVCLRDLLSKVSSIFTFLCIICLNWESTQIRVWWQKLSQLITQKQCSLV